MSGYKRFFIQPDELYGNKAEIRSAHNYISRVLRMRVGDKIVLCTQDGNDNLSEIVKIDNNAVYCNVLQTTKGQNESNKELSLFFGVMKGDKNDFVVQKAVELGVKNIYLFHSRYCVSDVSDNKLERLRKISASACEQCGRSVMPKVEYLDNFKSVANLALASDNVLFCYENEQTKAFATCLKDCPSTSIIVGSEGGFSDEEVQLFEGTHAQTVSLGKRILRAETASVFVLSVYNALVGD